jgi:hypothetical protein
MLIAFLHIHGYAVERHAGMKGARAACNVEPEDGVFRPKLFAIYVIDDAVQENELGGSASGLDFVLALRTWHPSARVIVCSSADCRDRAAMLGCTFVPKDAQFGQRFVDVLRGLS